MRDERYTIEVADDSIVIYGDLSIEEVFDFLNFFEKKGYQSVTTGVENSTLFMRRKSIPQVEQDKRHIEHIESEKFYEALYEKAKKELEKKEDKIKQLDSLVKTMFSDESEKVKVLKEQNKALSRHLRETKLADNPEFQKILSSFDMGCLAPGTQIKDPGFSLFVAPIEPIEGAKDEAH